MTAKIEIPKIWQIGKPAQRNDLARLAEMEGFEAVSNMRQPLDTVEFEDLKIKMPQSREMLQEAQVGGLGEVNSQPDIGPLCD